MQLLVFGGKNAITHMYLLEDLFCSPTAMKRSRAIKRKGPPVGYARRLETGVYIFGLSLTKDRFVDFR